jgi:HPt (histidine-containing phosphotransfer) domain-containing protein
METLPAGYGEDLLLEMQTIFANDNQNTWSDFTGALASGDIKRAHRIAHTLKSNAGTIGKAFLQKAAAEAEALLSDGENKLTDELINTIEYEFNAVLSELKPLLTKTDALTQPAAKPANTTHAYMGKLEIEELGDLLRKGNPDCLKFTEILRNIPGSEELIQLMEDFDFDPALESFAKLMKNPEARDG